MPSIKFDTIVETAKVVSGFRDIQNAVHQTSERVARDGKSIDDVINKIQNSFNIAIGGWSIGKFVNQMMQVRGQFQQTEMAFRTMLQSEEKADDLMKQMIHTAAITPFGVEDVTEGAKQLLAFNVAAEDVNKTLIGLGDVAAGMGLNLKDMVMLYGTTIAKGKMDTMDLYQFLNRGIPIADELAKVMGLDLNNAIGEVQKQIKAGKVTSDVFIQAMQNMTAEGSKFGGLMEAQSKTITGQISNIEDDIEQMFNELGKSQEGVINTGLEIVSKLVDNWETVGKVLLTVVATYGAYKAAVIAMIAIEKARIALNAAQTFISLARSITSAKDAMALFNLVSSANTLGIVLGVVTAGVTAFKLFGDSSEDAAVHTEKFGEDAQKATSHVKSLFSVLDTLGDKTNDQAKKSKVYKDTLSELTSIYSNYGIELTKIKDDESNLIDVKNEAIKKSQQLIEQIRLESAERNRANAISRANEEYNNTITNAQNDLINKLKKSYGDEGLGVAVKIQDLVSEDELRKLEELRSKMQSLSKDSKEYESSLKAYYSARKKLADSAAAAAKGFGKQSDDARMTMSKYLNILEGARTRYNNQTAAVNKAADATENFGAKNTKAAERVREIQRQLQKAGEDVHTLYGRVKTFMENYSNNNIKFHVQFDAETPKWMENMDIPELGRMGKYFSALAKELANSNKSGAKVNGKWMSRDAIAQRGYDYTKAANDKQTAKEEEDRRRAKQKQQEEEEAKNRAKVAKEAKKKADDQKKAQEQLNEDLKQLEQKNVDDTISLMREGTEKKLKEIDNDYVKRMAEIGKQEAEFKKKNKEAGKSPTLTNEQSSAIDKARQIAEDSRKSQLNDYYYEQGESMRSYLKDYGTYQQKRLTITEEYAAKIREVNESTYTDEQKKWQISSLEGERKRNENNLELEAIKQNIDWGSVFADFGVMFKESLEPTIKKLQELSKQTTDINEQKTIQELIAKLQGSNTVWDGDVFKNVSDSINAYQSSMSRYNEALDKERIATEAVASAQKDFAKAQSENDPFGIESAEANLAIAQNNLTEASKDVTAFGNQVQQTTSDLQAASQKAVSQFQQLESGISGLTSGSFKGIGDSILGLDKLFGGNMQKDVANTLASTFQSLLGKESKAAKTLTDALGNAGMAGQIISSMLGILDLLKDGFSNIITNLIDTVLGAVSGILDDVLSGDIIIKPLKSIGDNVSHILNTVTFGGFNSLFGGDGNAKKVNKTIEDLTSRNEKLQQSIEDLTDAMEKSYGSRATDYYEQARKNQEETNRNYLDIAKAQAGYHGSHHSWNYYWGGFGKEEMDWIKKNVKNDFNGDLFSLSPEEMKLLRGNVAIWEHIESSGKGDYGKRLTEKLDDYIDQAGKLDELSDKMKESLTQISFDSMKDSFISNLMDMRKSASDFTGDFAEMMQKALLSYSMEDLINGDLKNLYDDWAKAIKENDGNLSQSEIDAFNKRYDAIVNEGLKRRDEWSKVTGYTGESSQSATSGGWQSMGQDTADELNGRFTALQIAGESIATNMASNVAQMETIVNLGISTNGAVLEIRNMMIMTNSYLEDIVKYAKLSYSEFGTKMDDMATTLKKI